MKVRSQPWWQLIFSNKGLKNTKVSRIVPNPKSNNYRRGEKVYLNKKKTRSITQRYLHCIETKDTTLKNKI